MPRQAFPRSRGYAVGVSGSVESGRFMLLLTLCRLLRDNYSVAVVTCQQPPDRDGGREYLLRHRALVPTRVAAVSGERQTDLAIERLMAESRPELIFLEDAGADRTVAARSDFTVHIVNGSGDGLSPEDVDAVASADLLVLNKTHLGPPLDVQRHVSVRESLQIRGAAPCVFAQLRHGIGTIEIVKPLLARWRQTSAPAVWAPAAPRVALTSA